MALPTVRAHVGADRRYAWLGPALLVTTLRGECGGADTLSGFYFREARHLGRLALECDGEPLWLCADGQAANDELSFVYSWPEVTGFGGGGSDASDDHVQRNASGIPQRALELRLHHRVALTGMETTLAVTNRGGERVRFTLGWLVDADFADLQEALSEHRQQHGDTSCETIEGGLHLRYRHPELALSTIVTVDSDADVRVTDRRIDQLLDLAPNESRTLRLSIGAVDAGLGGDATGAVARRRHLDTWRMRLTKLETPGDSAAAHVISQAVSDLGSLALLEGRQDEWMAIQAGIPLYPALFGRDAITSGWQAAMFDQGEMIDAALSRLGRLQGERVLQWRDEEPGRIPQQVRMGPVSRLNLNPFGRSYADFASPLLFVIGLAHRYAWCGDKEVLKKHWDAARRVLDWARTYGDPDRDGYLEYETVSPLGPKNQGWKDSGRAILYEDGKAVPAPIATCDLQGYWFAAQQLMSVLSGVMGERQSAKDLWADAASLRDRFNRDWWLEDEGFVALALDPKKRVVRTLTSNVGQCLATGIIDKQHLPRVVGRLFQPDLFSGWGIRTLSTDHPSYHPLAYHLGSVWAVENATIAFGLRRFGFDQRSMELCGALFDLARCYERGRIPECVGGYARTLSDHPGAYPRANPIQAWNLSAFPMLLQSMLGLQPVAPLHLLVVDPILPEWMPELIVRDLRLGGSVATLRFHRDRKGVTHADVMHHRGPFHLVRQPPPESLHAGIGDRFRALADGILHH